MKKWFNQLKEKCTVVNVANLFVMAMVIYTVNATCVWVHHQPQIPEEAMKFRKF